GSASEVAGMSIRASIEVQARGALLGIATPDARRVEIGHLSLLGPAHVACMPTIDIGLLEATVPGTSLQVYPAPTAAPPPNLHELLDDSTLRVDTLTVQATPAERVSLSMLDPAETGLPPGLFEGSPHWKISTKTANVFGAAVKDSIHTGG